MDNIQEMLKKINRNSSLAPLTHEQFLSWQVAVYNKMRCEPNGYDCPQCGNRKFFATISGDAFTLRPCACNNIRLNIQNANNSGFGEMLETYTFENFEATEDWQKIAKNSAIEYTQKDELPWLYISGQSGSGKSHLCTAAATRLLKKGRIVKYVQWRDIFHKLDSNRFNDIEYNQYLNQLKEVDILVIDDFLKGNDTVKHGTALDIAFELINARYNTNRPCIISSELYITEVKQYDSAIAGRIKQRCGKFVMSIKRDESRNYRTKGNK